MTKHRSWFIGIRILCTWVLICTVGSPLNAEEKNNLQPAIIGGELIQNQKLRKSLEHYYLSEWKKDWVSTYGYRRIEFNDIVSFSRYRFGMEKAHAGINLLTAEIKTIMEKHYRADEKYIQIMIQFTEIVADSSKLRLKCSSSRCQDGAVRISSEATAWVTQNGEWKCLECGVRMHIPLNKRMLYSK